MAHLGRACFLISLLLAAAWTADGPVKNCYTCVGNSNDDPCLVAPEKVTVGAAYLPCKRKYCTIVRQEYTANPGIVTEITRGCEDTLPHANGKEVTDEYTTYYWTCKSNLCNTGDGTKQPDDNAHGGGSDVNYILVEGKSHAAGVLLPTLLQMASLLLLRTAL